jgi:hypothetical protein
LTARLITGLRLVYFWIAAMPLLASNEAFRISKDQISMRFAGPYPEGTRQDPSPLGAEPNEQTGFLWTADLTQVNRNAFCQRR